MSFTLSGAGTSAVNGCYSEAGTYNGKPYYSNGTYFVWYEGFEWTWFINQEVAGGDPVYTGSNENNVPSSWSVVNIGVSPAPTLSQGCTAVPAYYVAANATYGGKYCQDGTFNDGMGNVKPKYRKTGTSLYMYYVETNWRINDVGNLGELGSNVYAFAAGGNTPPTGMNWTDNNTGNDLVVANNFYSTSATATFSNTYVYYGNTYNGKPLYYLGGLELKYETSAGMWVIENPDPDPDNPIRLYQSDSSASTPPLTGWFIVNGSSPPPTLTGPTCGETTPTTTTAAPGGTTTTTTTTASPTTKSIQITSTNYNGQTAQVTFYSVNSPTTAVNLGPQTIPYSRSGNDVYGSYELNFTAYNKVCFAILNGPTTTTTTTTTAAPTTTTTTTTTAAPGGVAGFTVQAVTGGVSDQYGGTYCEDGTYTYDGTTKPKYRKAGTDYYIYWLNAYGMNVWAINNYGSLGIMAAVFVESNASTPPTAGWNDYDNNGVPTVTATTCV